MGSATHQTVMDQHYFRMGLKDVLTIFGVNQSKIDTQVLALGESVMKHCLGTQ